MKAVKHPGRCKLCGVLNELTFEHVPPEKAFNSSTVEIFPFKEVIKTMTGNDGRMPWDFTNLKGIPQQKGMGGYYLCRTCNNNTGSWYMRQYCDFAKTLHIMIENECLQVGNCYSFTIREMYPLRLFKAVMTLFCDINNECFGDNNLRTFLLDKESTTFDYNKYKVYMYLTAPNQIRSCPYSVLMRTDMSDPVGVSEISRYPVGFALYIDKPNYYNAFGLEINDLCNCGYNEKYEIKFKDVPYISLNSQFPADYRTKEEIIECINSNEKYSHLPQTPLSP